MNFNNQQEFDKNKQSLLTKTEQALNGLQMKTSNSTSIAGVCIIWSDFSEYFGKIIENFRKEIERLKQDIENVAYNEAKELQKLLSDERKLQKEIEENERKARNETDENKRKQFIFLADQAKGKWKKVLERKSQLKSSRLGDDFNPDQHIDNFLKKLEDKLSVKNRPPGTNNTSRSNPTSTNTDTDPHADTNSNYSPNSSNDQEKPFLQKYWKELLLISAFLGGCYYILNQKDHEKAT